MPQTLTGWILFSAIMFSSAGTMAGGLKLIMVMLEQGKEDRHDLHTVYAFGTLLMLSTMLFLIVEPR
jgi:hypothetical protein